MSRRRCGAERGAHRRLPASANGTHGRQARHVRAHDQQQQQRRRRGADERGTRGADQLRAKGQRHPVRLAENAWMLAVQPIGEHRQERVHVRLRRVRRARIVNVRRARAGS